VPLAAIVDAGVPCLACAIMKLACLVVLAAACLAGIGMLALALPAAERTPGGAAVPPMPSQPAAPRRVGELVTTADWFDQIFRNLRREDGDRDNERRFNPSIDADADDGRRSEGGRFRTMCVRLCDGFPIPISFSTTRSRFAKDARRCAEACPGGRLFAYHNAGAALDSMVDLDGHPYRQLPTAFLYQSTYLENCTCHGNPWDQAAIARHKGYADAAAAARASRSPARSEGRANKRSRWVESHIEETERR